MKSLLIALALFGLAAVARSGTPTITGPCPDFKPVENLDGALVAGDWFALGHGIVGAEIDKTKPVTVKKCVKKNIVNTPTGFDTTLTYMDDTNKPVTKSAKGTKITGTQAKYTLSGEELEAKTPGLTLTLSVISADANMMAGVVCFSDGTKHGYKYAIYGRKKTYPAADMTKINEVLKTHGITGEVKPVDQSC